MCDHDKTFPVVQDHPIGEYALFLEYRRRHPEIDQYLFTRGLPWFQESD